MADNPFELKHLGLLAALGVEPRRNSLLDYIAPPTSRPEINPKARALGDLLNPSSATSDNPSPYTSRPSGAFETVAPVPAGPFFNPFASLLTSALPSFAPSSPPTRPFGSLLDLTPASPPAPYVSLSKPKPVAPETKRKAFFSFHHNDIMRVNNVRNAWKITHPDSSLNRSFYDSSLWEARKLVSPEGIKQLIRSGVLRTSAVCVLTGSMTWDRRWVKYEIARAIIDGRGLLTVHLNGLNHHQTRGPHPRGLNPLAHMGVAKLQPNKRFPPQYFLYEMKLIPDGHNGVIEQWRRYDDYTAPLKRTPVWLTDPDLDHVMPLSVDAAEYDYELDHGHRNIGSWIDQAAKQAARWSQEFKRATSMTKQLVTESMLASTAAQQMREQPGCRTCKSVEIDVTPLGWSLGTIIADGTNPSDITRGRIVVQRDMKLKYDLHQDREAE